MEEMTRSGSNENSNTSSNPYASSNTTISSSWTDSIVLSPCSSQDTVVLANSVTSAIIDHNRLQQANNDRSREGHGEGEGQDDATTTTRDNATSTNISPVDLALIQAELRKSARLPNTSNMNARDISRETSGLLQHAHHPFEEQLIRIQQRRRRIALAPDSESMFNQLPFATSIMKKPTTTLSTDVTTRRTTTTTWIILLLRMLYYGCLGSVAGAFVAILVLLILHANTSSDDAARLVATGRDLVVQLWARLPPFPFQDTASTTGTATTSATGTATTPRWRSCPAWNGRADGVRSHRWTRRSTCPRHPVPHPSVRSRRHKFFSLQGSGIRTYMNLFHPLQDEEIEKEATQGAEEATTSTAKQELQQDRWPNPASTLSSNYENSKGSDRENADAEVNPLTSSSWSTFFSWAPQGQQLQDQTHGKRKLSDSGSGSSSGGGDPTLVVAGKMTVVNGPCNIGQYNLRTGEWSLTQCIQLSLYNSYSGGEVYTLLLNRTANDDSNDGEGDDDNSYGSGSSSTSSSSSSISLPSFGSGRSSKQLSASSFSSQYTGEVIVVGAFDTTYKNSQITYCSVGEWDGYELSKIGEGLCNSALSRGMKITTAALAGPKDIYVAGSFQTQVWNGERHEFVKIFNIAHFNAVNQVWLPLKVGQISCSWCTVTVLALAWDNKRRQLHVAGKFNAIDGRNVPAGLAIYDDTSGRLVAHPGGGLSMMNSTQDGVGTALQLDEERGVLYVMGSFERLTSTYEICLGLAAYEIEYNRWTCLADAAHSVMPSGGGNMLLTPYGLMVAGKTTASTTWPDPNKPYTIALLNTTLRFRQDGTGGKSTSSSSKDDYSKNSSTKSSSSSSSSSKDKSSSSDVDSSTSSSEQSSSTNVVPYHSFQWSWLAGFNGHDKPLHCLANGFGDYEGTVFISGDDLVAKWSYQPQKPSSSSSSSDSDSDERSSNSIMNMILRRRLSSSISRRTSQAKLVPTTEVLSTQEVFGAIMSISQMVPQPTEDSDPSAKPDSESSVNLSIIVYCVAGGAVIGVIGAILFNRNITSALFPFSGRDEDIRGFTLDTLTYGALENQNITEAYYRAMKTRYVQHPLLLTLIDPQEIFLQRIIGEGTFGRVWSARWRSASVAVKEFVFAQAAVAGRSSMRQEIVEEIIGEAGMMAILRHPNVLQLFGCSLTVQAIWIVSELCSLGSLRQLLDDERPLPLELRLNLALQVAEGMTYLHNQDPPIIHRDLKSHNIFVHETFTDSEDSSISSKKKNGSEKMETHSTIVAKIGDWGSARATLSGSRTMTHGVGTACWLAPEVIKHARSSKFSDVYGYGIVLWELATREEVYQGLETTQIIARVAHENLRPPVPMDCPWKDLMVKCWAENPQDRMEFREISTKLGELVESLHDAKKEDDDDEDNTTKDTTTENEKGCNGVAHLANGLGH